MTKTATIYISNDPTTLGPDATSDDLSRYADNIRQGAIDTFDLDECVVNVGSVARSDSDVPEIREWLRDLEAGDGWLQFVGEPAEVDDALGLSVPFCACGRRLTECDGSRAGCHRPNRTGR